VSLEVTQRDGASSFRVRVVPRAKQHAVGGVEDGVLSVRLAAPPVEGKANEALRAFLAERLGVRRSAVRIEVGERSRHKIVSVEGVEPDRVRSLLT